MKPKGHCKEMLAAFSDYISGEAAEALCAEIEAHLAECKDCQLLVDALSRTVTLCRSAQSEDLPGPVKERLYRRLDLSDYLSD